MNSPLMIHLVWPLLGALTACGLAYLLARVIVARRHRITSASSLGEQIQKLQDDLHETSVVIGTGLMPALIAVVLAAAAFGEALAAADLDSP